MRVPTIGLVAVALLLAGCADRPSGGAAEPPATGPAAPDGAVTTRSPVMVLDDGDGAELCLGGVDESLPPQCGGPALVGWDWADHDGQYEDSGGVRWGEFKVTGTFDGTDIAVTEAVPAAAATGPEPAPETDFSSPCPEPAGGWPDRPVRPSSHDAVFEAAQRLPGYAGAWVTPRDPRTPEELDQVTAEDPEAEILPPIVNVRVTGNAAAVEAELREVWDGPLCVTTGARTEDELRTVQDELNGTPGMLYSGVDVVTGTVRLGVTYDDGTVQAELDRRYGDGVVEVESALVPAG